MVVRARNSTRAATQALGTDGVRAGQGRPGVFSHHSQEEGGTIPGGRGRFGVQGMGRIRTLRV